MSLHEFSICISNYLKVFHYSYGHISDGSSSLFFVMIIGSSEETQIRTVISRGGLFWYGT